MTNKLWSLGVLIIPAIVTMLAILTAPEDKDEGKENKKDVLK